MITNETGTNSRRRSRRYSDKTERLYVCPIREAGGHIQSEMGGFSRLFRGEMLFDCDQEGGYLAVTRLDRMAFYVPIAEPGEEGSGRIGVLSLTGPVRQLDLKPGPEGELNDLHLWMHYRALSLEREPLPQEQSRHYVDAIFPRLELVSVTLRWMLLGARDLGGKIVCEIKDARLIDQDDNVGLIREITLNPWTGVLIKAGTWEPFPAKHSSLESHCDRLIGLGEDPDLETVERRLPIKFINLSSLSDSAAETLCQEQMAGICEVWRNKGALDLLVWPNINPELPTAGEIAPTTPQQKAEFGSVDRSQETELPVRVGGTSPDHVEVYLVDELLDRPGGGIAHDCGQASAYCILGRNRAATNRYLLAHELGHVMGLSHPGEAPCPGSPNSVLQPTGGVGPNPTTNTLHNFRIFTTERARLNSIVATTAVRDFFHPD